MEGKAPKKKKAAAVGVPVRFEEVKMAFEFLDEGRKGYLTKADLQAKLPLFYKSLKPKEYAYLMNKKSRMTVEDLYTLLAENELTRFDPVAEAFQFYDPEGTGFIDPTVLRSLLEHLGLGTVSDEDLSVLVSASDVDGDGFIGLEDFRLMLEKAPATGLDASRAAELTRRGAEEGEGEGEAARGGEL